MPEVPVYDFLVAGSGFAGSLMALALHQLGFRVCLVEKGKHPRFAVGESSTPVADLILRELSAKYHLPWLKAFSRYGSWQKSHPQVVCGLKRGFSFFRHFPGETFSTNADHDHELLVAASSNDSLSDTNWLRSDFDAFLAARVRESGLRYMDLTEIISLQKEGYWEFGIRQKNEKASTLRASFFVEATGSGHLLNRFLAVGSSAEGFHTHSSALFSHFTGVGRWGDMMGKAGIPTGDYPYDADHSAVHHILEEGWMWVLRFNDERTSLGFVLDSEAMKHAPASPESAWQKWVNNYPSIREILTNASLAAVPGKLIFSGRLQRKLDRCFGPGWVALPHTAGFVDPLFSPGNAYTLSGVEALLELLANPGQKKDILEEGLARYQQAVFGQLELIDLLIAGCYQSRKYFDLFKAWSMLYFALITSHERLRIEAKPAGGYLLAGLPSTRAMVEESYRDLLQVLNSHPPSREQVDRFTDRMRVRIEPINSAGLMDPSARSMYFHTAAEI